MVCLIPKRVLYVDESNDDCELLTILLNQEGYEATSVQSFTDAFQLIENRLCDLCLINISLWDTTGFEFLKKVREKHSSLPLLICSADTRVSTQQQAIQLGAHAFLTKPIDCHLLVSAIAQHIQCSCPA